MEAPALGCGSIVGDCERTTGLGWLSKSGIFDAFVARDMNGDGDIEPVSTRGNSGEFDGVFWLQQLHSDAPVSAFEPACDAESEPLPLP